MTTEKDDRLLTERALAALDCRIDTGDGAPVSIRDYLKQLLRALWNEADCFDAKRPMGCSDWQTCVYTELVFQGYVCGACDDDGCLESIDVEYADRLVMRMIDCL
jgi:hypothetical protein